MIRTHLRRLALLGLLLAGLVLAGCSSSSDSNDNAGSTSNVTLKGQMTEPTVAAAASAGVQPMAIDYSQYMLYCVTFTDPAESGTGSFDSSGNFSVTVSNAAGVPVGCFITDTTGTVITTVTFVVGTAGGLDSGTGSASTFDGGTATITIAFDATSGTATATVTSGAATSTTAAVFDPADLTGSWNLSCSASNSASGSADCTAFLADAGNATSFPIYLDVITATVSGAQAYAMGVWPNQTTFDTLGKTEGIASTLPPEVTGLTSLIAGADPTAKFNGFTSDTAYDYNNNTLAGGAAWTYLQTNFPTIDQDTDTAFSSQCHTDAPIADPYTTGTQAQRNCLLMYLNYAAENMVATGLPWPIGDSWNSFAGSSPTSDSIQFRSTQVASTPEIRERYSLMDLEVTGSSAVASEHWSESWSYMDGGTSVSCNEVHDLSIVIVIDSTGAATGWFTGNDYEYCSNDASPATPATFAFQVDFTR